MIRPSSSQSPFRAKPLHFDERDKAIQEAKGKNKNVNDHTATCMASGVSGLVSRLLNRRKINAPITEAQEQDPGPEGLAHSLKKAMADLAAEKDKEQGLAQEYLKEETQLEHFIQTRQLYQGLHPARWPADIAGTLTRYIHHVLPNDIKNQEQKLATLKLKVNQAPAKILKLEAQIQELGKAYLDITTKLQQLQQNTILLATQQMLEEIRKTKFDPAESMRMEEVIQTDLNRTQALLDGFQKTTLENPPSLPDSTVSPKE